MSLSMLYYPLLVKMRTAPDYVGSLLRVGVYKRSLIFSPMCIFIWCVHVNKSTTEYKVFEFDVWAPLTDLPNSIHPDLVTAAYTCKQCVWLSYWWQKYPLKPLPHSAHMATLLFWGTLRWWITSLIMPGEGCFSDVKQFLTVLLFLTKRHNWIL